MASEDGLAADRLSRLSRLTLVEREDLALIVGDLAVEMWLRGEGPAEIVERALDALYGDPENGPVEIRRGNPSSAA
jgi:hypothetical protein